MYQLQTTLPAFFWKVLHCGTWGGPSVEILILCAACFSPFCIVFCMLNMMKLVAQKIALTNTLLEEMNKDRCPQGSNEQMLP